MFKSFWFYLYLLPVLFSIIVFSLPINFFEDFINSPLFSDAVEYCKNVLNDDPYATEYGTMQDECIAKYMGEPKILRPLIFLFSLAGLLFIFPLSIYLLYYYFVEKNK